MSATGKLLYVFTGVLSRPGSAALFVALMGTMLFVLYPRAGARRAPHPHRFAIASLLGLIACLLIGTFAPTPLFPVYFYAPLPFVILLVLFASADPRGDRSVVARVHGRLVWLGVIAIGLGVVEMDQMGHPRELLSWVPLEVHRAGREVCRTCPRGRILTLSPIFALEGGAEIYEELATGPFAMRAGDRVREADEQNLKLMDEEDLPELFERRPPTAVLSGLEGSSDDALVAMAASREFVERRFTVGHRTLLLQARGPGDARVSNQPVIGSPSR
jgi:hypothetical protein